MLSAALLLLCNSLFLSLHLTGTAGSFPKPLSAARERECLERCAAGDLEARNILVELNLRLVAHIIKKERSGLSRRSIPSAPTRESSWPPTPLVV